MRAPARVDSNGARPPNVALAGDARGDEGLVAGKLDNGFATPVCINPATAHTRIEQGKKWLGAMTRVEAVPAGYPQWCGLTRLSN
jgi:hypothetical protein